MKRIEWLQWITTAGTPSKAHERAAKSICRIFEHPTAIAGTTAFPARPDAERCPACDEELRDRGKRDGRRARRRSRSADVFQPKHTFEKHWDR